MGLLNCSLFIYFFFYIVISHPSLDIFRTPLVYFVVKHVYKYLVFLIIIIGYM